jgi:hypothetical protein
MACHLIRSFLLAALATAIALPGCDKSPPVTSGRTADQSTGAVTTRNDSRGAERSETTAAGSIVDARREQSRDDALPPWLDELFRDSNPNVRMQALDA